LRSVTFKPTLYLWSHLSWWESWCMKSCQTCLTCEWQWSTSAMTSMCSDTMMHQTLLPSQRQQTQHKCKWRRGGWRRTRMVIRS
jgi:hypothetical protein